MGYRDSISAGVTHHTEVDEHATSWAWITRLPLSKILWLTRHEAVSGCASGLSFKSTLEIPNPSGLGYVTPVYATARA